VPILALKSPHTNVVSWGYRVSRIVSNWFVAWVSCMFRFESDVAGGMYTLTMFILWLFGRMTLVCRPYSLPVDISSYSGFRMYVARPPLVFSGRRCSTNVNPSIAGAAAPSAIHVSYRHKMSTFSCSRSRSSLI
jgi:hypothetical protein